MTLSFGKKSCPTLLLLRCEFFHNLTIIPRLNACKFSDFFFIQTVHPSLLNKIAEMEEAFDKPVKGRPTKGKDTGENDAKGLSRGNQKKVNEFMADLKGVMVSKRLPAPLKSTSNTQDSLASTFIVHQEDIFEQDREDALSPSDKATCQKL